MKKFRSYQLEYQLTHSLNSRMEEMIAKLSATFKKYEVHADKKEDFGDEMTFRDYWLYDEPHQVEFWSIFLISTTN